MEVGVNSRRIGWPISRGCSLGVEEVIEMGCWVGAEWMVDRTGSLVSSRLDELAIISINQLELCRTASV